MANWTPHSRWFREGRRHHAGQYRHVTIPSDEEIARRAREMVIDPLTARALGLELEEKEKNK